MMTNLRKIIKRRISYLAQSSKLNNVFSKHYYLIKQRSLSSSSSPSPSRSTTASWYYVIRCVMFVSVSWSSIVSIPSSLYQCRKAFLWHILANVESIRDPPEDAFDRDDSSFHGLIFQSIWWQRVMQINIVFVRVQYHSYQLQMGRIPGCHACYDLKEINIIITVSSDHMQRRGLWSLRCCRTQ